MASSPHSARILVADDDPALRELVAEILLDVGYSVHPVRDGKAAIAALSRERFDLIVSDVRMPEADGMAVVRAAQRRQPPTPVILLTAFGSIEGAVEAMRLGAFDYLTKPLSSPAELRELVARALAASAGEPTAAATAAAEAALDEPEAVYVDPASRRLLDVMCRVAARDTTVLLLGESGVGKEVAAREIHRRSQRASGPFVAVNCGAIPRDLFESQAFGHMKGSFTGATQDHKGFFEQASGGTLLLDEVGELPAQAQVKLLRVLEGRRITRVGEGRERPVDVRVIAATHRHLQELVESGEFRQDLYYRLSVFPLDIPALRERPRDIVPLARMSLARMGEGHRALSPEVERALEAYDWPGNVRELRNVIERALIMAGPDPIEPHHVNLRPAAGPRDEDRALDLKDLERQAILDALDAEGGNRRLAADRLGIALRTLQYKLKSYGMTSK